MPPRRHARPIEPPESIRFAVEDCDLDYVLAFNDSGLDELGRGWETLALVVRGPLRSRTRRKASRVVLRVEPWAQFDPDDWKEHWKALGYVKGVRRGAIEASVRVPAPAFQAILVAVSAGKLRGLSFSVEGVTRGRGAIRFFRSADPEEAESAG